MHSTTLNRRRSFCKRPLSRRGQAKSVRVTKSCCEQRHPSPRPCPRSRPAQSTICNCIVDTKENNWWDVAVLFRHKGSVLLHLVNAEDAKKVVCTERLGPTEGMGFIALGSKLYVFVVLVQVTTLVNLVVGFGRTETSTCFRKQGISASEAVSHRLRLLCVDGVGGRSGVEGGGGAGDYCLGAATTIAGAELG
ncbi:unnamed protein product [Linum trigynum]|uniref:Uncharacterized protein n=1 Tax=Linum trigynum TaxID=586398 RepID=A0AAV2G0S3_9ROSI